MRLIDADALRASMYHEAFEKDTDFQKWDSGCWIRYKLFENVLDNAPTIETISIKEAIEEYYKRQCDAIAKAVFSIRSYDKDESEVKPIEHRDCEDPPMVNITKTWY